MKISEFLQLASVIPNLSAETKVGVIDELAVPLGRASSPLPPERFAQVLKEREKLGSTGIGEGVAIPHAKLPELKQLLASFGVSRVGVNFDAIDGRPTYLFFALIAPENSAGIHLKALARISRLFKSAQFRTTILEAKTADEIYTLICQEDAKA